MTNSISKKKFSLKPVSATAYRKAEKALFIWGRYNHRESGGSLDALKNSTLAGLVKTRVKATRNYHRAVTWSVRAAYMDKLVGELTKAKPKLGQALKQHYTEPSNIRAQAEALGVAKSTYYDRLQKGTGWVARAMRQSTFYFD